MKNFIPPVEPLVSTLPPIVPRDYRCELCALPARCFVCWSCSSHCVCRVVKEEEEDEDPTPDQKVC